jgi:tRNA-Thr(GGU) m(6)t(6)A37 methyltransferase TsaA
MNPKTDPIASQEVTISPIAFVSSPAREMVDEGWGNVVARLKVRPEFAAGLRGLEQFSHAIVVTYLHLSSFDPARHTARRPRDLDSMPVVGIFSQRAKDRPNPIGITAVKILGVGDGFIDVRGLDAVDGTPVLDIKPYVPQFDRVAGATVPAWMDEVMAGYF